MALRPLLRRIPNPALLLPPSVPRMGTVHGILPVAAARFMKTGSQGTPTPVAEPESIRFSSQHFIDEQNKHDKEFSQLEEAASQRLAEFHRAVDNFRKVGNASAVVIAAIPLIMVIGSNYQA